MFYQRKLQTEERMLKWFFSREKMENPPTPSRWNQLVRIANPYAIMMSFVLYAVGVGVLHYLGKSIDSVTYWLGLFVVILFELGGFFLKGFFDANSRFLRRKPQINKAGKSTEILPMTLMEITLVCFGVAMAVVVLLIVRGDMHLPTIALFLLAFSLMVFYSMPPFRLAENGFGELARTIYIVILLPALAYVLQTNNLHRLIPMITFPLALLYLAMELALSLQTYGFEMWGKTFSMMGKLGWQKGMNLHNLLLLIAYLLMGVAALFGQPWQLTWPVLLSLPVSILQILIMWGISNGAKPHWRLVIFCAYSIPALSAYLVGLTLWIR
jgi:1,4-dihydroxy-2-naphthoate octaprenyltransferase